MTYQRFIDRKDKIEIIKSCPDFRFRRHGMPPSWILYSFVIAMLVVVVMINYMSIMLITLPENEPTPIMQVLGFLLTISTLILGISVASYIIIRRISAIVLQTEFQNLLFVNGMNMNTKFAMVTHPKHGVVYFDYNFDQFFRETTENPDQMQRLLESGAFDGTVKAGIVEAIDQQKQSEFGFEYKGKSYNLTLAPLNRPKGFVIVRAYAK